MISFHRFATGAMSRIHRLTQGFDRVGQWIREVLVLAASEAMPLHHDAAAKQRVAVLSVIERGERLAFLRAQQTWRDGRTETVQLRFDLLLVQRADTRFDSHCHLF